MNTETKNINLSKFKDYLTNFGYSQYVMPTYIRKVNKFLEYLPEDSILPINCDNLKKTISQYIKTIPISFQKDITKAALHTYYYCISGNQFSRRLCSKKFTVDTSIEHEIERFRKYLTSIAHLSNNSINSQCSTVKNFLYYSFSKKGFSPKKITLSQVRIYFSDTLRHVSASSKKTMLVRIRSYIRFLEFTDGFQSEQILKLPMIPAVWKHSRIPKYLTMLEIERLFSTYNLTDPIGIRNYAIARCMKDLGLRCSEVANLTLDDFDWSQGIIIIRKTKTHSERSLPLHKTTGEAIQAYLMHSRPITMERILFVRFKNVKGFSMGTSQIRGTVRIAAVKAGLENFTGTHMLRYSAAKEMICNGVDLKTIADVLGHESIETTSIYTKLDFTQLKDVAGVWPEVRL